MKEKLAVVALAAASLALVLLVLAGPGTRFRWWGYKVGLALLAGVALAALAGGAVALLSLVVGGARGQAGVALLLASIAGMVPLGQLVRARGIPMIHDITTDPDDPPAFVAVVPRRTPGDNPVVYEGAPVAALQRAAYPDLRSLDLAAPPARAFEQALAVVRAMGWEVVAAEPASGRIEATDTTFWFGFKDDVSIRIRPQGEGSRIDVRSISRVGKSDVGTNANRIRRFLRQLAVG